MDPVKRIGPPEVVDAIGSEYRLSIPLNTSPSPTWQMLFRQPGEWTSLCHPRSVAVSGDHLFFEAEMEHVPLWVDFIDRWIRSANGSFAVDWKRRRAELEQSPEVRQRRVDGVRDLFRQL